MERYTSEDWQASLDAIHRSQQAELELLRGLDTSELTSDRGVRWHGRPITIAGILRAAVRDEDEHTRQILAFAGRTARATQ